MVRDTWWCKSRLSQNGKPDAVHSRMRPQHPEGYRFWGAQVSITTHRCRGRGAALSRAAFPRAPAWRRSLWAPAATRQDRFFGNSA